ncbi:VWA domain-containing protein [Agreia sp. COWG]|uniref:vWA domain-containing protein n=1 Tax=Agreia sp. COWG TaxID=2773266 RepID=UPI001925C35A|nr:VWA domain-containing protein [Agreia sp. COWG]CAD6000173.1 VWFA domain-containing protein [Agreia sp. COWG]
MTFSPMLPPALIGVLFLVLGGFIAWQLFDRSNRSRRAAWTLRGGMVVLIIAMLLRPGLPGEAGAGEQANTDADVLFVVDTTTSIVAEDWDGARPRLEGVKNDIARVIEQYPGARFGLISFDSSALLRVPLTSDSSALSSAVAVLTPEITIYSAGSSVTEAATLLADTLARSHEADASRQSVVYYLGDGEQTSTEPIGDFGASREMISAGYVFGYGTEAGGPMRTQTGYYDDDKTDNVYVTDSRGERGMSAIDENNLRTIASQLGVSYEHRTTDSAVPAATGARQSGVGEAPAPGTIELYWIFAALLVVLVSVDVGRGIRRLVELGEATRRAEET